MSNYKKQQMEEKTTASHEDGEQLGAGAPVPMSTNLIVAVVVLPLSLHQIFRQLITGLFAFLQLQRDRDALGSVEAF